MRSAQGSKRSFTLLDTALKNAGVSVEMHLYAQGGHAFGLRRTKFPVTRWPELVETWLGTIGMVSE
jgi:acetyl esterase/lipase